MSQAVFANFLNVSVSTVQKWESPTAGKRPSGAAAKLLQLVETKGIEVLLTRLTPGSIDYSAQTGPPHRLVSVRLPTSNQLQQ